MAGKLTLGESFSHIGGAKLVICNSSMAMHAAGAFRRPAVALGEQFSSASQHWRQWGYPETTALGRDEGHPGIFNSEGVFGEIETILPDL